MVQSDNRVRLCFSLLVLLLFAGVGSARGQEPSGNELFLAENQEIIRGDI